MEIRGCIKLKGKIAINGLLIASEFAASQLNFIDNEKFISASEASFEASDK